MDRIDEIKNTIERNSKMIQKYSIRIQELKEELNSIDSQIKWVPHAELDEKMEKESYEMRVFNGHVDPFGVVLPVTPSATDKKARQNRAKELEKKRISLQEELDTLIREKERLRDDNLRLREETRNLK